LSGIQRVDVHHTLAANGAIGFISGQIRMSAFGQLTVELLEIEIGCGVDRRRRHKRSGEISLRVDRCGAFALIAQALHMGDEGHNRNRAGTSLVIRELAPHLVESGFPDLEIQGWMAFFSPAGTPSPIARRLQDEINRIVKLPDVRERIHAFQVEPAGNTSEELARMISSDITRWTAVAKASNIKPGN
jgi:hypothetical protein